MKRLPAMAAASTALALLTGCSSMPSVSEWQTPWHGDKTEEKADQEGGLARLEPSSQAIKAASDAVLAATSMASRSLRADARCIEPHPTMQFEGDFRCQSGDPVWSAARHREHLSDAEAAQAAMTGLGDVGAHLAAFRVGSEIHSRQSAQRSGVDRMALAWSRYCDAGRGMTDEDWSLVSAAGESVPDHLQSTCIPPK